MAQQEIVIYHGVVDRDAQESLSSPIFWEIILPTLIFILVAGIAYNFIKDWRRKK